MPILDSLKEKSRGSVSYFCFRYSRYDPMDLTADLLPLFQN